MKVSINKPYWSSPIEATDVESVTVSSPDTHPHCLRVQVTGGSLGDGDYTDDQLTIEVTV